MGDDQELLALGRLARRTGTPVRAHHPLLVRHRRAPAGRAQRGG
ncbi:hypothetical protein [Actinacidiphila glaucinigra]